MKIFEILLLLVSVTSFLIYEKIPLSTYLIKVKKELKEIGELHALENLEFPDFVYGDYSLDFVKSKAVFFNVNMLSTSASSQSSNVVLSFYWDAKSGETNYISPYHSIYTGYISKNSNNLKTTLYEIEFEVETSKFQLTKTWELNTDGFYNPTGSVDNTYISFKVKNLDDSSPFSDEVILEVVNAFLEAKKNEMNNAFTNNGVQAYYKAVPFEELVQKIYTQTSTSIANENNIDLTLESTPEFTNSNLILKRKAKLNDLVIDGSSTLTDTSSVQKFYINKKLIQKLISENLFNIVFEQTNNPSPEYELTIAYLKKIMTVSGSEDTQLKVLAEMTDVAFKDENAINGIAYLTVYVISKSDFEVLLDFELQIEFKFTPTLLQNGLNFVLLSKDLNILSCEPTQKVENIELLKSWIENTYLVALGNSEFNLFSLSFDLSPYFSSNKLSYEFTNDYLSIFKQ